MSHIPQKLQTAPKEKKKNSNKTKQKKKSQIIRWNIYYHVTEAKRKKVRNAKRIAENRNNSSKNLKILATLFFLLLTS